MTQIFLAKGNDVPYPVPCTVLCDLPLILSAPFVLLVSLHLWSANSKTVGRGQRFEHKAVFPFSQFNTVFGTVVISEGQKFTVETSWFSFIYSVAN